MKKVSIDLQHCNGIKSLTATLDFSTQSAQAIYAEWGHEVFIRADVP